MAFFLLGGRRRAFPVEEDVREPDEDERELVNFERHCNLLDTSQYHGLQRVQIEIWLLFEDASSSLAAQVPPSLAKGFAQPMPPLTIGFLPRALHFAGCSDWHPPADHILDYSDPGAVVRGMQMGAGHDLRWHGMHTVRRIDELRPYELYLIGREMHTRLPQAPGAARTWWSSTLLRDGCLLHRDLHHRVRRSHALLSRHSGPQDVYALARKLD